MKYTLEIVIDRPRDEVVALFTDLSNLSEWQPTLRKVDVIEGEPFESGTRTSLTYAMGRRDVAMVETVEDNSLPDAWTAVYESGKVWNRCVNRFIDEGEKTRWVFGSEFRMAGVMKVMSKLMPGMFRKESEKSLRAFKALCERG